MIAKPDRPKLTIRKLQLHDPPPQEEPPTPAECMAMMEQLADDAWAFMGQTDAESEARSRIIRVIRRPA